MVATSDPINVVDCYFSVWLEQHFVILSPGVNI